MRVFETEEYFREFEFDQPHLLSASDCESITVSELLELGGGSLSELAKVGLGYSESAGSSALRQAIASRHPGANPEDVVVLGAPIEGILLTLSTLIEPGSGVVTMNPAYDALSHVCEARTDAVVKWEVRDDGSQWRLDVAELEELCTKQTSLVIVNFPHNPTGYLPTRELLESIVRICSANDAWLFSDEMYRGLEYGAGDQVPSMFELYDKCVVLEGVSKVLGLPGLRLGWLLVRDSAVRERIINHKHYTSMCGPQTTDYLGQCALRSWDALADRNRQRIQDNLAVAQGFFAQHKSRFRWLPPQAGSVSLAETLNQPGEALCRSLARDHGVILLPARFMGAGDHYVRFGFGRAHFQSCLAALTDALR